MNIGWVLPTIWFGLGIVIVICSLRAARSRRAYVAGVTAVTLLWVVAGAAVNAYFLARGTTTPVSPTELRRPSYERLGSPWLCRTTGCSSAC
jgi:hypothetical protein